MLANRCPGRPPSEEVRQSEPLRRDLPKIGSACLAGVPVCGRDARVINPPQSAHNIWKAHASLIPRSRHIAYCAHSGFQTPAAASPMDWGLPATGLWAGPLLWPKAPQDLYGFKGPPGLLHQRPRKCLPSEPRKRSPTGGPAPYPSAPGRTGVASRRPCLLLRGGSRGGRVLSKG